MLKNFIFEEAGTFICFSEPLLTYMSDRSPAIILSKILSVSYSGRIKFSAY